MLPALLVLPALSVALALVPIRRPFPVAVAAWGLSLVAMEVPLHLGLLVGVATAGALLHGQVTPGDLAGTAIAALNCAGLIVIVARHVAAARVLDSAFSEVAITGNTTTSPTSRPRRRTPWLSVLLRPWPGRPRDVTARPGMAYGPDPAANRFDLYIRTDTDGARADRDKVVCDRETVGGDGDRIWGDPDTVGGDGDKIGGDPDTVRGVLVHLHGGHFRVGGPSRESRAMLFDHAQRGWAAISATYHLSPTPEKGFPQHLVDIKRLIRWIRLEGPTHGIPADAPIVLAGSSAGAHITMMTALTANDPRFQPGFEEVDTTLAGAIGLYGYYGPLGPETRAVSDPVRHPAADAPPLVVVHGTADTYTPVRGSRRLVRHLREGSPNPVVYAELPGAQHGFDAVRSVRYLAVVDAVARFTGTLA